MATRTIRILGHSSSATVVFSFNGKEVFNGAVNAGGTPSNLISLFEFNVDTSVNGPITGVLTISSGEATIVMAEANYVKYVRNDQYETSTITDVTDTFSAMHEGNNTALTNRVIDGVSIDDEDSSDTQFPGAFHNPLSSGQTFSATYSIDPIAS